MAQDKIGPVLAEYVANAVATLEPTPTRIITYQPGAEVAWDEFCGGQVWGRVVNVSSGPNQAKASGNVCSIPWWVVTLGVGVLRCVKGVETVGKRAVVPTGEQITEDGAQSLADIATLLEVVTCSGYTTGDAAITYTPLGPNGGMAGGEFQFTIRIGSCACPEVYPPEVAEPEV